MKYKILILGVVVILVVSFLLSNGENITGEAVVSGQGCCELTCTVTGQSECPTQFHAGMECGDVSECNIGCCIDDEGYCYTNYVKNLCDNEGKTFVGARECGQFKQCLIAPNFPADQQGYLYTNDDGVLSILAEPDSGKIGTLFTIKAVMIEPYSNVKVKISSDNYERTISMNDRGSGVDENAGDETYTTRWDSLQHPSISEITNITLQILVNNQPKGNPLTIFLSPNSCVPVFGFTNNPDNKNIILTKASNFDYINLPEKTSLFIQVINNITKALTEFNYYVVNEPIDNPSNLNALCPINFKPGDFVLHFDGNEDFCTQPSNNLAVVTNVFQRDPRRTIPNNDFTKEFCKYIKSPLEDLRIQQESFISPNITILNLDNNSILSTDTYPLQFQALDSSNAKLRYRISLDNDDNQLAWGYMNANQFIEEVVNLEDGEHEIYVIVEDLDGNIIGDLRTFTNNLSNFVLQSTLTQDDIVALSPLQFSFSFTHISDDNLTYFIFDNKKVIQTKRILQNTTENIILNLNTGEHVIRAVVSDSTGRKASTLAADVTIARNSIHLAEIIAQRAAEEAE